MIQVVCLYTVAYILSPSFLSSKLALVTDVVDEGLNELGAIDGASVRVDSDIYLWHLENRLRQRELEMSLKQAHVFQR